MPRATHFFLNHRELASIYGRMPQEKKRYASGAACFIQGGQVLTIGKSTMTDKNIKV